MLWRKWEQPKLLHEPDERPNGNGVGVGVWASTSGSLAVGAVLGLGELLRSFHILGSDVGRRNNERPWCSYVEGAMVLITSGFSGKASLFLLPGADCPLLGTSSPGESAGSMRLSICYLLFSPCRLLPQHLYSNQRISSP